MCGELDEQVLIGQELMDRARATAKRMKLDLVAPDGTGDDPTGLAEAEGRAAYMDRVFRSALSRALDDVARAEEDEAVDALAAQAIALARAAGFLAGQLPPEADLYRAVIEAVGAGHGDAARDAEAQADHHHHHHHDHGHGHH